MFVAFIGVVFLFQFYFLEGRLAPHFLSVGSGVGLPSAVKDKYHTTDVILQSFTDLERTCKYLVRHEIEATEPGTNSPRRADAYTLTDPDVSKENKKRFMLTFGIHGREYISSETALYLARLVCEKSNTATATTNLQLNKESKDSLIPEAIVKLDATTLKAETKAPALSPEQTKDSTISLTMIEAELDKSSVSKMTTERIRNILKATEITFVPVVNADGRRKVERGESCTNQRKNGRNVDINRNFQNWFNPSNAQPHEEDYQGSSPMSEWETNIVKTLGEKFQPHAYIDIHSGDVGLGYVYGHSSSEVSKHDRANSIWTKSVDDEVFNGKVWSGNLARMGSMPYESHGSSCDYMYETHHAKISGTWEIWRKPSFFSSSSSSSSSQSASTKAKYEHVSVTLTPSKPISGGSLSPNLKANTKEVVSFVETEEALLDKELQTLVDASVSESKFTEGLGLSKEHLQILVQSMKSEGKQSNEIQTLLQEMSREQCFAYFNPIMPEQYDRTVKSFSFAILVGAEKLSSAEIVSACNN